MPVSASEKEAELVGDAPCAGIDLARSWWGLLLSLQRTQQLSTRNAVILRRCHRCSFSRTRRAQHSAFSGIVHQAHPHRLQDGSAQLPLPALPLCLGKRQLVQPTLLSLANRGWPVPGHFRPPPGLVPVRALGLFATPPPLFLPLPQRCCYCPCRGPVASAGHSAARSVPLGRYRP